MNKLAFKMRDAIKKFEELWSTLDRERIKTLVRFCLTRELTQVEERKDAADYAKNREDSFDLFDEENMS